MSDDVPTTHDLFAAVQVTGEDSLKRRLLQQGADVYCSGEFATLKDRLRHVIRREQFAEIVSGTNDVGRVEKYYQTFERIYGEPLAPKPAKKGAS